MHVLAVPHRYWSLNSALVELRPLDCAGRWTALIWVNFPRCLRFEFQLRYFSART
jgi:hypothetical protein